MGWSRIDDGYMDHPKIMEAGTRSVEQFLQDRPDDETHRPEDVEPARQMEHRGLPGR